MEQGDRTPSQFLKFIQACAGADFPEDTVRVLWQERLPMNIQAILDTQKDMELDRIATLADAIAEQSKKNCTMELTVKEVLRNVNKHMEKLATTFRQDLNAAVTQEIAKFTEKLSCIAPVKLDVINPQLVDEDVLDQCWYHKTYGKASKYCKPPCNLFETENCLPPPPPVHSYKY